MNTTNWPLVGACRCRRTRFEISAAPFMTAACHCRGCQRMSASAFSLTAMMSVENFRVIEGEPVKGGIMGPQLDHFFCPECKTWMFTKITGMDDIVNVRPTLFDDPAWCVPFIETVTAEKLSWASTPAKYSYEGFPPREDFPRIMQEFAQRS